VQSGSVTSGVRFANAGEIELAYECFGDPADPPVLLIMGLATQMLGWPNGFCAALADQGHFVIRFDNRDIGLSTHLLPTRWQIWPATRSGCSMRSSCAAPTW
jgi:pimeloyl-ACP methyl ester carboxylesterase